MTCIVIEGFGHIAQPLIHMIHHHFKSFVRLHGTCIFLFKKNVYCTDQPTEKYCVSVSSRMSRATDDFSASHFAQWANIQDKSIHFQSNGCNLEKTANARQTCAKSSSVENKCFGPISLKLSPVAFSKLSCRENV